MIAGEVEVGTCECGRPATANGRECPDHFRARLRSVRLDSSVTATRTKVAYYDTKALDETFGEDRVETYWDETHGQGHLERGRDGALYHRDYKGEVKVATDDVIDTITGGEEAADVI